MGGGTPPHRQSIIALIPAQGVETEANLQPIGLLSCIYRLWMMVRKHIFGQWSGALHGGRHEEVASLAFRTVASVELVQCREGSTLVAILGCRMCYERIEHRIGRGRQR